MKPAFILMSKKRKITDEERAEFRDKVGNIKPLDNQDKIEPTQPHKPITKIRQNIEPELINFEFSEQEDWHKAQDCIHFAQTGVQHRLLTKMKRGQLRIHATLDLHEMNRFEATTAMNEFINQAQQNNMKVVLIIHGKGFEKPILKNLTQQFLQQDPRVLAFHSATPKHGGTGAVYVLIKSQLQD